MTTTNLSPVETVRLFQGDCRRVLAELPDASVDSIVCDPPYEIGLMNKKWDQSGIAFDPEVWSQALRVLKPGGHLLAFGATRMYHRLGTSIEDAGFEIRDCIAWAYGCLSDDTEILINGEWAHYTSARVGDLALAYDKESDEYRWLPIEDTYEYEYSDTAFRIQSDHTDQLVSRNHRVLVERGGAYVFELAEEAAREREVRVPILEGLPELLGNLRGQQIAQAVRGSRHTVTDVASIEPVHYDGVVWCVKVPTGAFVARRNGKVFVTGNSGFPKSLDVGAAVAKPKPAGTTRSPEDIDTDLTDDERKFCDGDGRAFLETVHSKAGIDPSKTPPGVTTDAPWSGWGTGLKPAFEPVILARKALSESNIAGNVLKHGTGAINVGACRVGDDVRTLQKVSPKAEGVALRAFHGTIPERDVVGRWPANVIVDEATADHLGDSAKFFYCAKAPQRERPSYTNASGKTVKHSTVKPLSLMRYLVRLVTPPGGTVLDPFAGSGATLEAAMLEGFNSIGIELGEDHIPLILQRLEREQAA